MARTKTIKELRSVWESNKEGFKTRELGKLQDFIKDILESSQLFALTYGDLRKDNKKRKMEFICEVSKEGAGRRCADVVIFIDSEEIVIPVEIEKLDNIKAGESQLLQYQTDWQKKYGILTDGNEWRFYFDRWYETFYLKDIFDKESDFWQKWKLYISTKHYYDLTFNINGQLELFEAERLNPCNVENRPYFFNDITNLLTVFKTKITDMFPLFAQLDERQAVETTYSYVIQFILYKVLIDNNYQKFKNDYEIFREHVKRSLEQKTYDIIIKGIKKIAEYIYTNVYEPFHKKQNTINQQLLKQLKQSTTLTEIAPWLDIILFIDRYNFADIRNDIFGFVYENYLKELYHDENKGQYFTDPAIVDFMLGELGYTEKALSKTDGENISIIDPSCGAGTFLYSATLRIKEAFDDGTKSTSQKIERLVNENVYGLDIEEFPLFLAEMNILMQLLPVVVNSKYTNVIAEKIKLFITKDSISEFIDSAIGTHPCEENLQTNLFYGFDFTNTPPYMRDKKELVDLFKSIEGDLDHRKRFDYVIGNPPYIGYNRCTNIAFAKKIKDKTDPFTMGNVYGVNLNTVPNRRKPYPPKPNLYAFFIALGLGLLKEGGRICYIIPQTILTAGDLDVLRYHLSKYTTIEKIITFEGKMFIGRGLAQKKPVPTSSLIFVAKKMAASVNHSVKITNYNTYTEKQIGDFSVYLNSKNKKTKNILQTELLNNLDSWAFIKQGNSLREMMLEYGKNSLSIEEWRKYILKDYDDFCFDVGFILNPEYYTKNHNHNYPILDFKQSSGYKTMRFSEYYPKTRSKIKLTRNSRYETLDHKYNIVCRIKNFQKFMLIDEPVIFNMGQATIIATDNKQEAMFIFSLLNSTLNIGILKNNLKIENEKEFLVSIKSIKQYIRIPKITQENTFIKKEIIKLTDAMLKLETSVIKDVVEMPRTQQQVFDSVRVDKNNLILTSGSKEYLGKIEPKMADLAAAAITKEFSYEFPRPIDINELRQLPVIDFDEQKRIKDYIDDLVFALYFNVPINSLGIEKAAAVHRAVAKHEFFSLINTLDA